MTEPTWEYILKTQQEDFLERLKASLEFNPDYDEVRIHLARLDNDPVIDASSPCESINIYFHPGEESDIDDFCTELAWKFCYNPYDDEPCFDPDIFINNKLGKIGEVAVKEYLGKWVSNVDYNLYESGDGGVDFFVIPDNFIKIQVKTTAALRFTCQVLNTKKQEDIDDGGREFFYNPYKYIESSKWQVDAKSLKNTHLTIFVLLMNEIITDGLNANPYKCLLAGFLPNEKIFPNRKYSIAELLYSGGIRSYLKHLINIHQQ